MSLDSLLLSNRLLSNRIDSSQSEEEDADEDGILREAIEARFNKTVAVTSWYVYLSRLSNI